MDSVPFARRLLLLAVVGLSALALAPSTSAWSSYPTLDATASWLAQRPVTVRCLTKQESLLDPWISGWGAEAYVEITERGGPEDYAVFAYPWCKVLNAVRVGQAEAWTGWHVVVAILILTHESGHLRGAAGWKDEALVNCWAVRRAAAVAVLRFGLPTSAIPAINSIASGIYLGQPPEYQRPGCLKTLSTS
jgi:hypothetical protein